MDPTTAGETVPEQSPDFYSDFEQPESLAKVEVGLHRLGCRSRAEQLRLFVWLPAHPAFDQLSARELQLVYLASKGATDKEIALSVGLSVFTVRSYWTRICRKLGAINRTHAVSLAFASGAKMPPI